MQSSPVWVLTLVGIVWVVPLFLLAEYWQPVSILDQCSGSVKYYTNIFIFTKDLWSGSKFT